MSVDNHSPLGRDLFFRVASLRGLDDLGSAWRASIANRAFRSLRLFASRASASPWRIARAMLLVISDFVSDLDRAGRVGFVTLSVMLVSFR
jgi:hypothetical protein